MKEIGELVGFAEWEKSGFVRDSEHSRSFGESGGSMNGENKKFVMF